MAVAIQEKSTVYHQDELPHFYRNDNIDNDSNNNKVVDIIS